MNKKELRKEAIARRNGLSSQERKEKSAQIAERVVSLDEFEACNTILLYQSIRSEVETGGIYLEAKHLKKEIYVPRVEGDVMEFYRMDEMTEWEVSLFGIKEPKPESTIAYKPKAEDKVFVVMPGVAFDKRGNRIGYGGGYYDKYLSNLMEDISLQSLCKVAVLFQCQLVEEGRIPKEVHDVSADYIVTETELLKNS